MRSSLMRATHVLLTATTALWLVPAHAAETTNSSSEPESTDTADAPEDKVGDIVVTGTRATDITTTTATAPIDVVGNAQLTRTGSADLASALQAALPSVNFPQVTIGSAAGANLNATLRGLAPDQVLVLVNSRRQHKSSFVNVKPGSSRGTQAVDLATIPLSAIERVEVLRDAAAAQYGSDAIAGVINIVLRHDKDGGSLSARSGIYQDGDGFSTYVRGWKGFALPGDGFVTLALDVGHADATDQFTSPETRRYYFTGDAREATVDKTKFFRGQPEIREDARFAMNAETSLSDQLKLTAFGNLAYKDTRINGNPLLPNANETLRAFYPDGVRPNQWVFTRDATLGVGLAYDAGSIGSFDLNATYGANRESFRTTHSNNASLGRASPTSFDTGSLYATQIEVSLDYGKTLDPAFLAGPLTLSAGAAWRHETFKIGAGEPASYADGGVPILDGPNAGKTAPYGSMTWQAYLPSDAGSIGRDVVSGYVGAEAKLTDRLRISLNGRGEHYSDFGDVATGEASARWEFVPGLAARGSISTGVRAPSLGQSRYTYIQTTTITTATGLYQIKTFPVDAPAAIALGAADLKPEKSVNLSAGLVAQLGRSGSLTVDAYQIRIRDRIALSDNFTGTQVTSLLIAAGYPQAVGANFFTNALDTRTQGISVNGRYAFDLGSWGNLALNLGIEANKTDVTKIRIVNGKTPIGRQTAGYLEHGTPNRKIVVGGDWTNGPIGLHATAIFYGRYRQLDAKDAALDQTFSPQAVVNASLSYGVGSGLTLSVGADNLFGSTPDPIRSWYTDGGLPSSALNPVSWDRRFAWAKVAYDF